MCICASVSLLPTSSTGMYLQSAEVSACLTQFVPWNNPGLHNPDPRAHPHDYQRWIPEIKKGIRQKEDRKNNEEAGWDRGRKAVWLAGSKGHLALSSENTDWVRTLWQQTEGTARKESGLRCENKCQHKLPMNAVSICLALSGTRRWQGSRKGVSQEKG